MDKRVWLLGAVLALVVGCSAPAAYAPEDVAFLLPVNVGEVSIDVITDGLDEVLPDSAEAAAFSRALLKPLGKEPSDLLIAQGYSTGGTDLGVMALRVVGVPAEQVVAYLVAAIPAIGALPSFPPAGDEDWLTFQGRRVLRLVNEDDSFYFYPKGEVVFMVRSDEPNAETLAQTFVDDLP